MGEDDHHKDDEPLIDGEEQSVDGEVEPTGDEEPCSKEADKPDYEPEPESGQELDPELEPKPNLEPDIEPPLTPPLEPVVDTPEKSGAKKKWLKGLYWLAVAGVWFGIALGFVAIYLAADLPDLDALPPPGENDRVEIRANDGSLLVTYGAVLDKELTHSDIPDIMKQAIVAIEDRRFFEHSGIDTRSVLRALWVNLSKGRLRQGGSTLTQQLAKNIFLSHERTVKRKVQELLVSLWLEQKFGKETILTLYLNRVYFGSGTYGIEAASQKFFGHSAKTLSIGEAALLAGLVKAPSRLSPLRNKNAAYERSRIVLGAMTSVGFINYEEQVFWQENPPAISAKQVGGEDRYFTDWVFQEMPSLVENQHQPMVIYTSLNPQIQNAAVRAMRDGLAGGAAEDAKIGQGAMLALSFDGAVQAMVGGRRYSESQFNRSTQALRQPGSSFKPFIYLAAIEKGMSMSGKLNDEPLNIDGWEPNNFSGTFAGRIPIKDAFARSINTIAVQLSEWAGRENVIDVARRLGITSPMRPHPSIALGAFEVKMMDMVRAYSSLANGGYAVEPYGILEVRSISGALLYRRPPAEISQVISADNLNSLRPLLEAVVAYGTGRAARSDSYYVAAKSGTSQNYRDAWFIGYTGQLTAAVWLGNDDNTPMVRVTGGGMPARIWHQFMDDANIVLEQAR
ncbi:MAG: PBP1A family penicillin-binding protein [Sphingomonadales bacterium]|nr:PBP1A family penicillin-binding protein [Sphingomonadales bacterium]